MKRNELFKSTYLGKDDVPKAILATVKSLEMTTLEYDEGKEEKGVLSFVQDVKPMILNATNFDSIADFTGQSDSDDWPGTQVVIFNDPNVTYMGKRTGGLRIREPRTPAAPASPRRKPKEAPPADATPPIENYEQEAPGDDLPF